MEPTRSEPSAPEQIPLSEPTLAGNEWRYIKDCLETNWVSSVGAYVDRFERMVAEYVGTRYGVATVNGTAALHTALLTAGISPEDEVLVSTLSFVAPANAVRYCGAWPVFIDAEPRFWQMDAGKVVEFLTRECRWSHGELTNRATGRRVKAILPVHVLGHPVDVDPILEAAAKYELLVIEDATESLGAMYSSRPTGHLGHLGCFSFNGNKIITTGGGGMVTTDNGSWAARARYLTTQARDDALEYVHHEIGYNYRLTNIQAALGVAQMEVLQAFVQRKRSIASRYAAALGDLPGVVLHPEAPWAAATFWLYTVLVEERRSGIDSRAMQRGLAAKGVQSRPLWAPLHLQKPYQHCQAYRIEIAPRLYQQGLSLPSSVGLRDTDQDRVIVAVRELIGAPVA